MFNKKTKGTLFSLEQSIQPQNSIKQESVFSDLYPTSKSPKTSENSSFFTPQKRDRSSLISLEQSVQSKINSRQTISPLSSTPQSSGNHVQSFDFDNGAPIKLQHHADPLTTEMSVRDSPTSQSLSDRVQAFAFDNGVAIELQYRSEPFTNAMSVSDSFASAMENSDRSYPFETFEFNKDEDEFNHVEAFSMNEPVCQNLEISDRETPAPLNEKKAEERLVVPVNAISSPSITERASAIRVSATAAHSSNEQSPAIPVSATVVPTLPEQNPATSVNTTDTESSHPTKYTSAQSVPSVSTSERHSEVLEDDKEDALAFAADIEAILRGDKVHEPHSQASQVFPSAAPTPSTTDPSHPHDIFEQMGHKLAHANSFDLGTVTLEATFEEFDRLLDKEENLSAK